MSGALANWSEFKPCAKLELARSIDVVADHSERFAFASHADYAVHTRVSVLRVVGHVIARDIEAQRLRFGELERFVDGEVEIARPRVRTLSR